MGNNVPHLSRRASYGPSSPVVGERGVRTRQAILDAAVNSFQELGVNDTSVDDIAAAAGISRATLYQYFESKDQLFAELIEGAVADLLDVIRRPADLGPTAQGYDNLHRWLAELARVQAKYKTLSLQWMVIDSPQGSLRPLVAEHIVDYVSSLTAWLGASADAGLDLTGAATVLLVLLFRVNDYHHSGLGRGMAAAELVASVAGFVQFVLFPSTPAAVVPVPVRVPVTASAGRDGDGEPRRSLPRQQQVDSAAERQPAALQPAALQRILDAGAATFAVRGYHATSVQDVLDAARAGRATFYRYFGDKADLLARLSGECMARLVEQVGRFPRVIGDAAALRGWIEESLALHRQYRGVFRALLRERTRHPALEELRVQSLEVIFQRFDDALGSVARSRLIDVRAGSLILLSLLERGPDYDFGTPYDLSEERIVEVMAVLIERGLLGREAR